MKGRAKILSLILCFLLLTGCYAFGNDEFYSLPKRSEQYRALQTAVEAAMDGGACAEWARHHMPSRRIRYSAGSKAYAEAAADRGEHTAAEAASVFRRSASRQADIARNPDTALAACHPDTADDKSAAVSGGAAVAWAAYVPSFPFQK